MTTELFACLPRVVAVQGGARDHIQALLSQLAVSWGARGLRIAGVVEEFTVENEQETVVLRDLKSGVSFPLYQDSGLRLHVVFARLLQALQPRVSRSKPRSMRGAIL